MICPGCDRDNDPSRRYCGGCGHNLDPVCRGCSFGNARIDRFCGGCGEMLVVDGRAVERTTVTRAAPAAARIPAVPVRPAVPAPPIAPPPAAVAAPRATPILKGELAGLFSTPTSAAEPARLPDTGIVQDDLDNLFGVVP